MKDIKDYIQFYLGCDVQWARNSLQTPSKAKLLCYNICGECVLENKDNQFQVNISLIKPILRPLSSMTEEEAKHLFVLHFDADPEKIVYSHFDEVENYHIAEWDNRRFAIYLKALSPDAFIYLLSKGFDLFGLIESNLAVASNK